LPYLLFLFFLNLLALFLSILSGALLLLLFLNLLYLDCYIKPIDLPIMHTLHGQLCIVLGAIIDDCVVLDLGVLSNADGMDISKIGEDFLDVALCEIGR